MTTKGQSTKRSGGKKKTSIRPTFLDPDQIPVELEKLYPASVIDKIAEDTGFIKRKRTIQAVLFFWTIILEFGMNLQKTLSGLRRRYEEMSGEKIVISSWFERFTPELVNFMRELALYGLQQTINDSGRVLTDKLNRFKDVFIFDNSIVRVHQALAKRFPATRSKVVSAGIKVSLLISAVANGPRKVTIHSERTADIKTISIGPWVRDHVLLFDLGFYKFQLFARIKRNGGFFVSRMKRNGNPMFLQSLKVYRGRAIELVGLHWQEIRDRIKRKVLDADVEVTFSRRPYNGKQTRDSMVLRLVAIWDDKDSEYHVYMTNIPPDVLSAEDIAALYKVRWEVELVFKELKSQYALDKVKTKNPSIILGFIWAAIITLIVSRRLHNLLLRSVPIEMRSRYTPLRWSIIFMEFGRKLRDGLEYYFESDDRCWDLFTQLAAFYELEAKDPNVKRSRLRDGWYA